MCFLKVEYYVKFTDLQKNNQNLPFFQWHTILHWRSKSLDDKEDIIDWTALQITKTTSILFLFIYEAFIRKKVDNRNFVQ